jgi:2'-5' RNA ligase
VTGADRRFSLNAPVPGRVRRLASDLAPDLSGFERIRRRHSVVCKRLGSGDPPRLADRARRALAGAPAVEARVAGVDTFDDPPTGSGPVVYLAVESPGLHRLHATLCEAFEPVPDLEGDDYVPHVTLARGGDAAAARRLSDRAVESVTWTVSELHLWDARDRETVRRFSLPG